MMDFTIEPENTMDAGDGAGLPDGGDTVGDNPTGMDAGAEPVETPEQPAEGEQQPAEGEGEGQPAEGQEQATEPPAELAELQGKFEEVQGEYQKATETIKSYEAEAQQFVEALKADPFAIMEKLGMDPRQAAERYLTPIYEREAMEPAQRQALEAQELAQKQAQELEHYRQQEAERQKAEAQEREQERMIGEIQKLAKDNGLPQTQETIPYFARALSVLRQSNPHATLKDAVPMVKQAMETSLSSLVQGMTPEQIVALLGAEGAKGIRQHFVKTATGAQPAQKPKAEPQRPKQPRILTERDVWADWGL